MPHGQNPVSYTHLADDKDETETLEPTGNHKNGYVNWLPSLLFKYDVNDDLKLRTSFTETLSRPKYSALIPCVNINRSDNELVMGNSDLTPTISYNLDLSADYYFKSVGLISAGIFYKKINDFIVDQVIGDYTLSLIHISNVQQTQHGKLFRLH